MNLFLSVADVTAWISRPSAKRTGSSGSAKDLPSGFFSRFSTEVLCPSGNSKAVPMQLALWSGSSPSVGAGACGVRSSVQTSC